MSLRGLCLPTRRTAGDLSSGDDATRARSYPEEVTGPRTLSAVVIEDDADVRGLLETVLGASGFDVTTSATGREGLDAVRAADADVVTLDLQLPDLDGLEVCRMIRGFSDAYVIILTARAEEIDRLMGLETGADDYMTKPFSPRELRARVAALMRRPRRLASGTEPSQVFHHGALTVDADRRTAAIGGREVALTRTEFDLLLLLARGPVRVWTRPELVESVWGNAWQGDHHLVDVHVNNLRRKLTGSSDHSWIMTVRGVGYRLDEADLASDPT